MRGLWVTDRGGERSFQAQEAAHALARDRRKCGRFQEQRGGHLGQCLERERISAANID